MFLNPQQAIQEKWIRFPDWATPEFITKCIQPNAIDFTLDRVFSIEHGNTFAVSENAKRMRGGTERKPVTGLPPGEGSNELYWTMDYGMYDCLSDFYVELPTGVAAMLVPRSTLVRNGLFWFSGLFDSGFKGHIGGVLHNRSGRAVIAEHTRVGQIIFVGSDSSTLYTGGWSHDAGTHYAEKAK